jgi:Glycosyltransferases involved in cell wall biogenesis
MKPFYSVILPIYNAAETLAETLDSLLAQDYPSFEICAVNDGSSDGSRAILEAYRELHPVFSWKIVDRANGGLCAARYAGVAVAPGRFLCPARCRRPLAPEQTESFALSTSSAKGDTRPCFYISVRVLLVVIAKRGIRGI